MAAMPLQDKISQSSSGGMTFRVLQSALGDGQQQLAADGLNYKTRTYNIVWSALTLIELQTVTTALDTAAGIDVLTWTPHGSAMSVNWRNTNGYNWTTEGGDVYSISAEFVEDHR